MTEYKFLTDKPFKRTVITEENFNKLGKEGWELIKVDVWASRAYFKREIK